MFSSYSSLATETYDIDKPVGHSFGDIEYYLGRLKSCKGRVLEPAVGSGRMLIPLLEAGFIVDGMDNSPEMLASCRNRCEERGLHPDLYEASMDNFSLPHTYEAMIIPTGSFMLIEQRDKSLAALHCFYKHLVSGGKLIVDLHLQTDFDMSKINTKTWQTPQGDVITMEDRLVEVDFINQYTVRHLKYEKWRNGRLIDSELQRFPLRWYGCEEFKLILKSIGFVDIICSADYVEGKQPTEANQMLTFEAKKANDS